MENIVKIETSLKRFVGTLCLGFDPLSEIHFHRHSLRYGFHSRCTFPLSRPVFIRHSGCIAVVKVNFCHRCALSALITIKIDSLSFSAFVLRRVVIHTRFIFLPNRRQWPRAGTYSPADRGSIRHHSRFPPRSRHRL